jgi:hypothetical protein
MTEPRVLSFDIESAGINALRSDLGFVILFGWKWLHEQKAHVIKLDQKHLDAFDDSELLKEASRLLEQADVCIGHFASIFDRRFINGRLLINHLPPVPDTKLRDTCLLARKIANFSSNRLKNLAKVLNLSHQKMENNWPTAWFEVLKGNMTALNKMGEYCKGDVIAVEELYLRLRPFDTSHPRLYTRAKCGSCGGEVQYRGTYTAGRCRYRRFQCNGCGAWGHEAKPIKEN